MRKSEIFSDSLGICVKLGGGRTNLMLSTNACLIHFVDELYTINQALLFSWVLIFGWAAPSWWCLYTVSQSDWWYPGGPSMGAEARASQALWCV